MMYQGHICTRVVIVLWGLTVWGFGAADLMAWSGDGHGVQVRQVVRLLSTTEFPVQLDPERLHRYRAYPDSFDRIKEELVGAEALAVLDRNGIPRRFDLHRPESMGVAFELLVMALREGNSERAAVWAATLIHAIGDASGCNHDPIIHTHTYGFSEYGVVKSDGEPWEGAFDLEVFREGRPAERVLLEVERERRFHPTPMEGSADEVLVDIMMLGPLMTDEKIRYSARIVDAMQQEAEDPSTQAEGRAVRALAELGVIGSEMMARVLLTAGQLATAGGQVEVTEGLRAVYAERRDDHYRNKPLSSEAIFAELLERQTASGPAIGILVEPTYLLNDAVLGFRAKYLQASIARELNLTELPYRLLDLRKVCLGQSIDPATIPVLVVVSSQSGAVGPFRWGDLMKEVEAYRGRGGRLLWLGGVSGSPLGSLHEALQAGAEHEHFSGHWPVERERFHEGRITLLPGWDPPVPQRTIGFRTNPHTPAGWHRPYCGYRIPVADGLLPLIQYTLDDESHVVAAMWTDQGRNMAIFLPEYAIFPYLLGEEKVLESINRPRLDSWGRGLILSSVELLFRKTGKRAQSE